MDNEKSNLRDFINKPVIRALVNGIIDISLAVYTALVPEWNVWTLVLLAVIIGLDIFVIVYYGTQTINYRATVSRYQATTAMLKKLNCCNKLLIDDIDYSCENTVKKATDIINEAEKKDGQPSLITWNFQEACEIALGKMPDILKAYTQNQSDEFEIFYDRIYNYKDKRIIKTIACYTAEASIPTIVNINRDVDTDNYFDTEFVRNGITETHCLMNHDEVQLNLRNRTRFDGNVQDAEKYNQMFLVPVLCRKKDLIGVLVISCLKRTTLAQTQDEAETIIRRYIAPYLSLLIVFYKMEKVFKLQPIEDSKNDYKQ